MSTAKVACPHCGFLNFEISAYCARCERPMRTEAAAPSVIVRTPEPTPTPAPASAPSPTAAPPPPPAEALTESRKRSPWVLAFEQLPRTAVYPATSNEVAGIARGTFAQTGTTLTADDEIITVVTSAPPSIPAVPITATKPTPPSPPLESLEQASMALMPEPVTSVVPLAQLLNLAQRTPDGQPRVAEAASPATQPVASPPLVAAMPALSEPASGPEPAKTAAPPQAGTSTAPARRQSAPPAARHAAAGAPSPTTSANGPVVPTPAAAMRAWLGRAIDATIALGVGGAVMGALARAAGPVRTPRGLDTLDVLADWLTMYPNATVTGVAAAIAVASAQNLAAALCGGRTVGRAIAGTRLVRTSGAPASMTVVALRTVVGLFSLALFGAGYFWAIVDRRRRTWHDMFSGTVLARAERKAH